MVLEPGCTDTVLAHAAAAERHLAAQLGGHRLVGYSTHISVEVRDHAVVPVARLVARRMAIPLMLVLDRAGSPGVLVRPRPGRLEIGGEFAAGDQLRAAVALTVATVLLAERRIGIRRIAAPGAPRVRPARATERFGWYVDRTAFGPDLYVAGRATRIGRAQAQDVLARHWSRCRPVARTVLSDTEVGLVDHVVAGLRPLPMEAPLDDDGPVAAVPDHRHYGERVRGVVTVRVVAASWWKALLQLDGGHGSQRWVTLPGRTLDPVLDALDAGLLDDELALLCRQSVPVTNRWRTPA
ncbi:hypothetical protein [Nakamurella endophytica]|uniref:hypothetical protein n=1 Tax=Nakamurella endophytica TaxID=1748367 RepID=UPI00166EC024|nr:hypothetical protein [Nakamurella endophytica]